MVVLGQTYGAYHRLMIPLERGWEHYRTGKSSTVENIIIIIINKLESIVVSYTNEYILCVMYLSISGWNVWLFIYMYLGIKSFLMFPNLRLSNE